jgi:hypothetical protein
VDLDLGDPLAGLAERVATQLGLGAPPALEGMERE